MHEPSDPDSCKPVLSALVLDDRTEIDLNSDEHKKALQNWCTLHWSKTIKKSISSFNSLTYHDCCGSFSKRGFTGRNHHPPHDSCTVMKIPSFKAIKNPEEFYQWMLLRLQSHKRMGRRPLFPAINRNHPDVTRSALNQLEQENELLAKRVDEMGKKHSETLECVKQLKLDNERLQASSKNWCWKYQELLDRHRTEEDRPDRSSWDGELTTPRRKLRYEEEDLLL